MIELRGGARIPQLGFGVFLVPPPETAQTVSLALDAGYRHIDTATGYANEAGVGEAARASGIDRGGLFITTKCTNDDHGYEQAKAACHVSLEQLDLGPIDLYLIHWPVPSKALYVDTWRAFIDLQAEGLVRSIGVSNFQPEHLERLVAETGVTPAVNQIELHPRLTQQELRRLHAQLGIVTEAWSPLARGTARGPGNHRRRRRARPHARPGADPLAPADRQHRDPEIGHAETDPGELRRLRL